MENFAALIIPALLTVILVRTLLTPMKWGLRLAAHAGSGFACLWLMNTISFFTGICLPMNAVTVLISGFCGLPGMAVIALLEMVR